MELTKLMASVETDALHDIYAIFATFGVSSNFRTPQLAIFGSLKDCLYHVFSLKLSVDRVDDNFLYMVDGDLVYGGYLLGFVLVSNNFLLFSLFSTVPTTVAPATSGVPTTVFSPPTRTTSLKVTS